MITDELYSTFNHWNEEATPEDGYYQSNIHYDIFSTFESDVEIENRMLYFLKIIWLCGLMINERLRKIFIDDSRYLIIQKLDVSNNESNDVFFDKHANELEKVIYQMFLKIS